MMRAKERLLWLAGILVVAALCRYLFFTLFLADNPCLLMFDSGHYHAMASDLLKQGQFCDASGHYYFYRLPVYPLFLAASYSLGGVSFALNFQAFLSLLVPALCYFIACELGLGAVSGLLSALLVSIHPGFLIFPGLIMTEILFTLFFLLSYLFFLYGGRWRGRKSGVAFFCAGIFLGIATLTRPVGLPLLICVLAVLCIIDYFQLRKKIAASFILTVGWFCVVGVWLSRNYLLTGYIFLHTLFGNHCINHGAVPVVMKAYHCSYDQARAQVDGCLRADLLFAVRDKKRFLTGVEEAQIAQAYGMTIILSHPYVLAKHCLGNICKTLCGLYSSELLVIDSGGHLPSYDNGRSYKDMIMRFLFPAVHNRWIIPIIYIEIVLHLFILLGLFFFCWHCVWYGPWRRILFLCGPLIALFIGLSSLCGFARLRLPIECFLIMVAVAFWHYTLSKKR